MFVPRFTRATISFILSIAVLLAAPALGHAADQLPAPNLLSADAPTSSQPSSAFPSASEPLGHRHPSCFEEFGRTPEQIAATSCNVGQKIAAGSTIAACTHESIMDFMGDDITVSCVLWKNESDTAQFTTRCKAHVSGDADEKCTNIVIDRVTLTGNGGGDGVAEAPMKVLEASTRGGSPIASMKVVKSDISGGEDIFFESSASCSHPLPGEGDRALVLRGNRFHGIVQPPGGHSGVLSMHGSSCTLVENNRVDGSDAAPGSNVSATMSSSNGRDVIYRNNHFLSDDNGRMFRFDTNNPGDEWTCDDPVQFDGNVITWTADTYFGFGGSDRACPRIEERNPPSSCDGNTTLNTHGFSDGSVIRCSGEGR